MKKRTKITLTIAGLLVLAGLFYAANPPRSFFATDTAGNQIAGIPSAPAANPALFANLIGPTGVAAASARLLVTEFCNPVVDEIATDGMSYSAFATIPGNPSECKERYLAIAPALDLWTPNDVYVTDGDKIYKVDPSDPPPRTGTLFADLSAFGGCGYDHTGITFDHVGTFLNDMIVTCLNGDVYRIEHDGTVRGSAPFTNVAGAHIEGPDVAPSSFGTYANQLLVTAEDLNKVFAIDSSGTVTPTVFSFPDGFLPESIHVIPSVPCTFGVPPRGPGAFFSAIQQANEVIRFPASDFAMLGGDIIIPSEGAQGIVREHWNGSGYDQTFFDQTGFQYEGSSFVDCAVPTPTPTSTPTPSATATATFTPTPTPTPTFTPTPTPTPSSGCQTSIKSNFNGTPISAGNYIWFTSVLKASGLGPNPVTITFTNQTITSAFFTLSVPDATVTFDPLANTATITFGGGNVPNTTVPVGLGGNMFFSALAYKVPANLPGGINPVTWSGTISSSMPGVSVNWQWAAAVYTSFDNVDYNNLGVKPVDDNKASQYKNSDHAGTPENFKSFVIGGARGGGGSNYTGSYTGTATCRQ